MLYNLAIVSTLIYIVFSLVNYLQCVTPHLRLASHKHFASFSYSSRLAYIFLFETLTKNRFLHSITLRNRFIFISRLHRRKFENETEAHSRSVANYAYGEVDGK